MKIRYLSTLLLALLPMAWLACNESGRQQNNGNTTPPSDTAGGDPAPGDNAPGDLSGGDPVGCVRTPQPADRVRPLLVSHPFNNNPPPNNNSDRYALWQLQNDGTVQPGATEVVSGCAEAGAAIQFTPDGTLAIIPQKNGTLGVVEFAADGSARVLDPGFSGTFYAGGLAMHPSGRWLYVLDENTRTNQGGLYLVEIGCDGTLRERGMVAAGGFVRLLAFLPGDPTRALVWARELLDSPPGEDIHLLTLGADGATVSRVGGGALFPPSGGWGSSLMVMPNGRHALAAFDSMSTGDALTAIELLPDNTINPLQSFAIADITSMVLSPFGNAVLVVSNGVISGGTDGLFHLSYDAAAPFAPFGAANEITPAVSAVQLPSRAQVIDRGSLSGLVLVAEFNGIRTLQMSSDGSIIDLGPTLGAGDSAAIIGTIGLQP